ncbi:MAG: sulfatase-like hydrolase/transferase [Gemmataceae bacterium]
MTPRPLLAALALLALADTALSAGAKRPNILWLTCEDMSPNLGCFGDKAAVTPNLDRLAAHGVRYTHAFSVAGVCAPSRSCLITGMYPTTLGSHYMRCEATLPAGVLTFSEHLRHAGYFCTNNVKTDYNFAVPKGTWDQNSRTAHWRNRPKGKPFFAVFNNVVTHESQIRTTEAQFRKNTARLTAEERHDPAKVVVPPFHPDTPEVRRDWARMFDLITAMDRWVGDRLAELEKDGLADDTVVFFYSDHGVGLPRGKRWLYDTGMRVPLVVRFGKNFAHLAPDKPGSTTDRLVSFVDFGPTALSLAGVKLPANMQGVPFFGEHAGKPREAVHGIRDRMDERNDTTRAVRDQRFKYVRNYHAYKPWAQPLEYMEHMPTMKAWRALAAVGKLDGAAALWMRPTKPFEELYDTVEDPHEVCNLADSEKHRATLERLRGLHLAWYRQTRDLGLMPEALVHERSKGRTGFELGRDAKAFPQERLLAAAEAVARGDTAACRKCLSDRDSAVRWWGATGLGVHGGGDEALRKALDDEAPVVRVAAADGLRRRGQDGKVLGVLTKCLKDENPWVRHAAALAIDELGAKAAPARAALAAATKDANQYVVRVASHTLGGLSEPRTK